MCLLGAVALTQSLEHCHPASRAWTSAMSRQALDEALPLEVLIGAPVIHVALCILELLLHLCFEPSQLSFLQYALLPVSA